MRRSMSTKATFVTLSRALCSNGIIALFGISKLPELSESGPSFPDNQKKAEMIERFKIPKDACMLEVQYSFYKLDHFLKLFAMRRVFSFASLKLGGTKHEGSILPKAEL